MYSTLIIQSKLAIERIYLRIENGFFKDFSEVGHKQKYVRKNIFVSRATEVTMLG